MNTTMTTESSVVKRLELSMDRKSRFNKSLTHIKDKHHQINFNMKTEPEHTDNCHPSFNEFNYPSLNHKLPKQSSPINEADVLDEDL
jgi:hypothetical protein